VQHFGGSRLGHSHDLGRRTQGSVFLNIQKQRHLSHTQAIEQSVGVVIHAMDFIFYDNF
jgi:hypothetical protein